MTDVETIIVGSGPAGSSAARELVRAGRECLVLDRKPMPRLKLCAGWITPKVVADLEIAPGEYPRGIVKLDRMQLFFGRGHRRSRCAATEQYSIRRIEFDAWLLERSGAKAIEHTVRKIDRQNGQFVIDGEYRCRQLIGAGGTNCPVKKAFFGPDSGQLIVTQEVEFETTPRSDTCTLWFPYAGKFGYAWYVPKAGAVNVGFGGLRSENEDWDKDILWREFVTLLQREGCLVDEPPQPKGYSYYVGRRRKLVKHDRAYIVGDAAGLATVDLAEGIGPAVESGQLAAREILGRDTYSARRITQYSLPWSYRLFRQAAAWWA
jgi:flavin-dependent dehydrogenase